MTDKDEIPGRSSRETMVLGEAHRVYHLQDIPQLWHNPNLSTLQRIARIKDDLRVVLSFLDDYASGHFTADQLELLLSNLQTIEQRTTVGIANIIAKRATAPKESWNTGILEMNPEVVKALKKD